MAAIHFTTIPCEPNTCILKHKERHIYVVFVPMRLCVLGLKIFERFLYVFMGVFFKFPCAKN